MNASAWKTGMIISTSRDCCKDSELMRAKQSSTCQAHSKCYLIVAIMLISKNITFFNKEYELHRAPDLESRKPGF
jgi:hypothetical protein